MFNFRGKFFSQNNFFSSSCGYEVPNLKNRSSKSKARVREVKLWGSNLNKYQLQLFIGPSFRGTIILNVRVLLRDVFFNIYILQRSTSKSNITE